METSGNGPVLGWFKAKRYGIGWVPATWQGWAITLTYAILVTGSSIVFTRVAAASPVALGSNFNSDLLIARFCLWIFVITLSLLWICYKTGDTPSWTEDTQG